MKVGAVEDTIDTCAIIIADGGKAVFASLSTGSVTSYGRVTDSKSFHVGKAHVNI